MCNLCSLELTVLFAILMCFVLPADFVQNCPKACNPGEYNVIGKNASSQCARFAPLGAPCTPGFGSLQRCANVFSSCQDGTCQCLHGFVPTRGDCIPASVMCPLSTGSASVHSTKPCMVTLDDCHEHECAITGSATSSNGIACQGFSSTRAPSVPDVSTPTPSVRPPSVSGVSFVPTNPRGSFPGKLDIDDILSHGQSSGGSFHGGSGLGDRLTESNAGRGEVTGEFSASASASASSKGGPCGRSCSSSQSKEASKFAEIVGLSGRFESGLGCLPRGVSGGFLVARDVPEAKSRKKRKTPTTDSVAQACPAGQYCYVFAAYPLKHCKVQGYGHCCPQVCPVGLPHPTASCDPIAADRCSNHDGYQCTRSYLTEPTVKFFGKRMDQVFSSVCCPSPCPRGMIVVKSKWCMPSADIGEACISHDQCPLTGSCAGGICGCTSRQRLVIEKNGQYCLDITKVKSNTELLGSSCKDQPCLVENSHCDKKTHRCRCSCGYRQKENSCIKD